VWIQIRIIGGIVETSTTAPIEVGEKMVAGFAKKGLGQVNTAIQNDRGDGPYHRMVLRGLSIIDGIGAPPWESADILIEGNRTTEIAAVGVPGLCINSKRRPAKSTQEIDCDGKFSPPGFIDSDAYMGTPFHTESGEMLPLTSGVLLME
jgi:imidazolonepropionase